MRTMRTKKFMWKHGTYTTLAECFDGGKTSLQDCIDSRVHEYMAGLAGHPNQRTVPSLPEHAVRAASARIGVTKEQIRMKIGSVVYQMIGVGSNRDKRERIRRACELREYAESGARTIPDIRAADDAAALPPSRVTTPNPGPPPALPMSTPDRHQGLLVTNPGRLAGIDVSPYIGRPSGRIVLSFNGGSESTMVALQNARPNE